MKRINVLLFAAVLLTGSLKAQMWCDATSNGAGNIFGGNILALEMYDDSGQIFGYVGVSNNSSQIVLNPASPFTLSSWEFFRLVLKGTSDSTGNSWWTKAGVWIDLNRDGNFSASECIADPQNGPYSKLTKDNWTDVLVKIPGVISAGKTRLRIRGFHNAASMTTSMGCGASNAYGNQIDMEVNLFVGSMDKKNFQLSGFSVYPNPVSDKLYISGLKERAISTEYVISDLQGKIISRGNIQQQQTVEIPVQNLNHGMYVLSILEASGPKSVKFTVQ